MTARTGVKNSAPWRSTVRDPLCSRYAKLNSIGSAFRLRLTTNVRGSVRFAQLSRNAPPKAMTALGVARDHQSTSSLCGCCA
jgi:hypothetical protein